MKCLTRRTAVRRGVTNGDTRVAIMRDDAAMVSSRLKEPWSAVAFASTCKEEVLQAVQARYHDLEQHVRLRVLLAALQLRRGPAAAMAPLLARLAEDAQIDEDDWVQVFGHAVGDFTGPLHLARVADNVPSVSPGPGSTRLNEIRPERPERGWRFGGLVGDRGGGNE